MTLENTDNKAKLLKKLLTRPIAYHPALAVICNSVTAGIVLSQLIYWSDRGQSPDGWIYKTNKDLRRECAMTPAEFKHAKNLLLKKGLIKVELRGWPAKSWYLVSWSHLEYALTHDHVDWENEYGLSTELSTG